MDYSLACWIPPFLWSIKAPTELKSELNQIMRRLLKMQVLDGEEEWMADTVVEWLEVKKMVEDIDVEDPSSWGNEEPSSRGEEVPDFDSNNIYKKKMQQHEGNSNSAIEEYSSWAKMSVVENDNGFLTKPTTTVHLRNPG